MKKIIYISSFLASLLFFASCETEIDPELEKAETLVAVDGWINDKPGPQIIKVMLTQSYFDNTLPPGLSGATVKVENITSGKTYSFTEISEHKGDYVWTPSTNSDRIGIPGDQFHLLIEANGETYEAVSKMGRVPVMDSITFTFEEENAFQPDSWYAEFWAKDPDGAGDTYWIRTTKNDTLLNKPGEINIAYDAGFSKAANFDGLQFFPPIRYAINPFEEDENDKALSPYDPGDSVYVEINSITESAFNYLTLVISETDRPGGFGELFSSPLANVSTNINNVNPKGKKAVGFFNVAAVSGGGKRLVIKN